VAAERVAATFVAACTEIAVISLDNTAHKRYKCSVIVRLSTGGRYNYRLQSLNVIGTPAGNFG
jgi:hypothetical protein